MKTFKFLKSSNKTIQTEEEEEEEEGLTENNSEAMKMFKQIKNGTFENGLVQMVNYHLNFKEKGESCKEKNQGVRN